MTSTSHLRLLPLFLAYFAALHPSVAQKFSVRPDSGGVIIAWEGLHSRTESEGGNEAVRLPSKYSFREYGEMSDCLRLVVAVPGEDGNTVKLNVLHTVNVGKTDDKSAAPSVLLRYAGMRRGAPLAELIIRPFGSDPKSGGLTLAESGSVNIRFGGKSSSRIQFGANEAELFADVANAGQLTRENNPRLKNADERPLGNEGWYNPSKTYLRISTTRDGVAWLTGAELIAAQPAWNGKPTANLELLHNGQPYPLATLDADGTITAADTLFFAGRRTKGDSTYYDYVTESEPFFLTLNDAPSAARLQRLPDLTAAETADVVDISLHLEEDHDFSWGELSGTPGTSSYDSENFSFGKGYFWKTLLTQSGNNTLQTTCRLLPAPRSDLNIALRYYTRTLAGGDTTVVYNVRLNASGDSVGMQEAGGFDYYTMRAVIPAGLLLPGANSLSVVNPRIFDKGETAFSVDYLTLSGRVRPLAFRGAADFSVPPRAAAARLSVPGFGDGQILAIDTASGAYSVVTGTAGTFAAAGAKASGELSVTANDTSLSGVSGNLLIAAALPDGGVVARVFDAKSGEAEAFLNALPDGTGVAAAYNGAELFAAAIRAFFTGQGAAANAPAGAAWACILRKNVGGSVREQVAPTGMAAVSDYFSHTDGKNFRARLTLPAGGDMPLLLNDLRSAERVVPALVPPSDLRAAPTAADVVIVTHEQFAPAAERLAAHRRTQGYSVAVARIGDIYTEFSYGKKTPHAIKKYLQFLAAQRGAPPTHLLLYGDANWDPRRLLRNSTQADFVPTYGFPVADFWYGLLDGDRQYDVIVGRLPAHTPEDANSVVDKLIEYDTLRVRPWMRKFFFLSGGTGGEQNIFYNFFDLARETILNYPVCIDTHRIRRDDKDPTVNQSLATTVRAAVNEGAVWMNFWGHGAPEIFDVDGWQVNTLTNKARYNVLTTFACQTGAFANPYSEGRNEGYVMAADKGSIAAFGNTGTGVVVVDNFMNYNLFQAIRDGARRLGDILYRAKEGFGNNPEYRVAQMQYSLIGDPLTTLALDSIPDLYVLGEDVRIEAPDGSGSITESDSLTRVRAFVRNVGTYLDSAATVRLIHRFAGTADTLTAEVQYVCAGIAVEFTLKTGGKPGRHDLLLEINPDGAVREGRRGGNSYATSFDVLTVGVQRLDPLSMWDVSATSPAFRFVRPDLPAPLRYECELWNAEMSEKIASAEATETTAEITVHEAFIEWRPAGLTLVSEKNYIVKTRTINTQSGNVGAWLTIPFYASAGTKSGLASWKQGGDLWKYAAAPALREESGALALGRKNIPVTTIARGGTKDGSLSRYSRIIVGPNEYIERPDMSSFNIVHLPPFDSVGKYRDYWGFAGAHWPKDRMGNADAIVQYLRDSVAQGDAVVISVSDGGFNGFLVTQPGVDGDTASFLAAMRTYGAVLTDTILLGKFYSNGTPIPPDDRLAAGYVMIGVKGGATGSALELCGGRPDLLTISDSIAYLEKSGAVQSGLIGPAASWKSAAWRATMPDSGAVGVFRLSGIRRGTGEEALLAEAQSPEEILLDAVSAEEFPYMQLSASLERSLTSAEPLLHSWSVDFTPAPEFAVLKNASVAPDSVLRGDAAESSFTVRNIAPRAPAGKSVVFIAARPEAGAGTPEEFAENVPALAPDKEITIRKTIQTAVAGELTGITATADHTAAYSELYRFNNTRRAFLRVGEDRVPPSVEVFVDGVRVQNGAVVAPEARFDIVLHDNSRLPVDSVNLRVRLNRFLQPDASAENASFTRISDGSTARARLSFFSKKTLETGDNVLIVYAEDASANRDTLRLTLRVVLNGSVENIVVAPNPLAGSGEIRYTYNGRMQDAAATVKIFTAQGKLVRTLNDVARIGANAVAWDGRDGNGDAVPPGLYVFVLTVSANSYIEPQAGRLILVR